MSWFIKVIVYGSLAWFAVPYINQGTAGGIILFIVILSFLESKRFGFGEIKKDG